MHARFQERKHRWPTLVFILCGATTSTSMSSSSRLLRGHTTAKRSDQSSEYCRATHHNDGRPKCAAGNLHEPLSQPLTSHWASTDPVVENITIIYRGNAGVRCAWNPRPGARVNADGSSVTAAGHRVSHGQHGGWGVQEDGRNRRGFAGQEPSSATARSPPSTTSAVERPLANAVSTALLHIKSAGTLYLSPGIPVDREQDGIAFARRPAGPQAGTARHARSLARHARTHIYLQATRRAICDSKAVVMRDFVYTAAAHTHFSNMISVSFSRLALVFHGHSEIITGCSSAFVLS